MLRRGYLSGVTIPQLAAIHGRDEKNVRRQLKRMKLLFDASTVERYGVGGYMTDEEADEAGGWFYAGDEEDP